MADREIDLLPAAGQITLEDLFLLKQGGVAKKLTGQVLIAFLTALADGHGGIHTIEKTGTEGLVDTYRITLADGSTFGYTVTNGEKGDKGDNAYTWIKYASQEPTADSSSMGDIPDKWMGIYAGPLAAPPEDWAAYKWFEIKGQKGDTGNPAVLQSAPVTYQVSASGSEIPTGEWSDAVPDVPQGSYLWSRIVYTFNSGDPVTVYSVSRVGIDGLGTLRTINGIEPDENGNINLTASNVGALAKTGDTLKGALNANSHAITNLPSPVGDGDAVPYQMIKNRRVVAWSNAAVLSEFAAQRITLPGTPTPTHIRFSFWSVCGEESDGTTRYVETVTPWMLVPSGSGYPAVCRAYFGPTIASSTVAAALYAYRDIRYHLSSGHVVINFSNARVQRNTSSEEANMFLIPLDVEFYYEVT